MRATPRNVLLAPSRGCLDPPEIWFPAEVCDFARAALKVSGGVGIISGFPNRKGENPEAAGLRRLLVIALCNNAV
jgi:hypothetical protein